MTLALFRDCFILGLSNIEPPNLRRVSLECRTDYLYVACSGRAEQQHRALLASSPCAADGRRWVALTRRGNAYV